MAPKINIMTDVNITWTADGETHCLGSQDSKDIVRVALFLRSNPAPCGWIKFQLKNVTLDYTNKHRVRSTICGTHELFLDLVPPKVDEFSAAVRETITQISVKLSDTDVLWIRDPDEPVTVSPAQMQAINEIKSLHGCENFTIEIGDNKFNDKLGAWCDVFAADRTASLPRYNFIGSKRGHTENKKPTSEYDWDVYRT